MSAPRKNFDATRFEYCKDPMLCVTATCCCPFVWASTISKSKVRGWSYVRCLLTYMTGILCALFGITLMASGELVGGIVLASVGSSVLFMSGMLNRWNLRDAYDIAEDPVDDCISHMYCCVPCSLGQEALHVRKEIENGNV